METNRGEAARRGSVWLDRTSPPHIVTLVLLTGIPALNMNMILPSMPRLAEHYSASYGVVAITVSGYLALTAVLQIVLGPLSDRFGRRPVVLGSFLIFLVATVGCIVAPTIELFLAFRMMQAVVAAGIALSRAIVRDMVPPNQAASMIGYVTMGMSVMPMVGPMLGGFLDEHLGWQSVFVTTFILGALVTVLLWADLGETNQEPSDSFSKQFRTYPELLGSASFWGYALTATFASGAFFAFLGGAPLVATVQLGMSPSALGFYFGFVALGYMVGNYLSGRFAGELGINRMMLLGGIVGTGGMLLALALFAIGWEAPLSFFGSIFFVGLGNGLLLPSANAGLVSVQPHLAGSAAGLGGALLVGGGAALSVLAGGLLGPDTGVWPLLFVMLASSGLGLVTTLYLMLANGSRGV